MHFIILKEYKLILFWSSKTGSTTIKTILLEHLNLDNKKNIHNNEFLNKKIDNPKDLDNYKLYNNYTKCLIYRNPYHRLVSSFLNKYVGKIYKNPDNCNNFSDFVNLLYNDFLEFKNKKNINYNKTNNVFDNNHFRQQASGSGWKLYIKLGKPKFDFIYDTKNVNSICKLINLNKEEKIHARPSDLNTNINNDINWEEKKVFLLNYSDLSKYKINYDLFYNKELKKKVNLIYKDDFNFLNSLGLKKFNLNL